MSCSSIIISGCSQKCEFTETSEIESGSYCYSSDGTYYQEFELYYTDYEYDFDNWELVTNGIITNHQKNYGSDEPGLFKEICGEYDITVGNCE